MNPGSDSLNRGLLFSAYGKRKQKWKTTGLAVRGNKKLAEKMLRTEIAKAENATHFGNVAQLDEPFADWIRYWLRDHAK